MKKILTIALTTILIIISLSGCLGFKPDRSYLTPEKIKQEEQQLNDAIEKYNSATDDAKKNDYATSIAYHYMNLGDYDKAIDYYEEVIKFDPAHYPALNNLAVMYEEMGKIDKAIKYEGMLYDRYTDNVEVNGDFVRLLIENKQFAEAGRVVEAFKKTEKAKGNEEFIKSLEKEIEAGSQKAKE